MTWAAKLTLINQEAQIANSFLTWSIEEQIEQAQKRVHLFAFLQLAFMTSYSQYATRLN